MTEIVLGLICLLCVAVAGLALVCRQRAFSERDEARREAVEWKAVADALNESRFEMLAGMRELAEEVEEADQSAGHWQERARLFSRVTP